MSEEGKDKDGAVGKQLDEGEIQPDKDGKHPETVPWSKYVGIKESLGGKLDAEKQKVSSLEEQIKKATSAEEVEALQKKVKEAEDKLKTTEEELTNLKNSSVAEKRASLTKRGIPEEKVKDMTAKELDAAIMALGHAKPGADLGGGGGSGEALKGSPMELAVKAYTK